MTSEKQIQANRQNALKGGVKTEAGKAVSRLNAVTHGIFSGEALLPGENKDMLDELRDTMLQQLKPEGELETILVERIIHSTWRLKRILRSEGVLSPRYLLDGYNAKTGSTVRSRRRKGDRLAAIDYRYSQWQTILKYETAIERQVYKAMHELERLQAARLREQAFSSMAFHPLAMDAPIAQEDSPAL
jgi:hypothetical protein